MFRINTIYHVYNRGINGETLFYSESNYAFFREKIKTCISSCSEVLGYCLMPNHFHILLRASTASTTVRPGTGGAIPKITMLSWGLKQLLSSYAKAINRQRGRYGSLFCQNTRRKIVDDPEDLEGYATWCLHYIHMNPCKAGLVDHPLKWDYSSYREYYSYRSGVCNVQLGRKLLYLNLNDLSIPQGALP